MQTPSKQFNFLSAEYNFRLKVYDTDLKSKENLKTLFRESVSQLYLSNIFSFQNGQHDVNAENLSNTFVVNTGETRQIFTEAY
jgi:hypothetical protein